MEAKHSKDEMDLIMVEIEQVLCLIEYKRVIDEIDCLLEGF